MAARKVVLIPGDGIGPEITEAVLRVLDAAGVEIDWTRCNAGISALEKGEDALPAATVAAIKEHKVALKGPCTTPVGEGFSSVNVQLRKTFTLIRCGPAGAKSSRRRDTMRKCGSDHRP